MRRRNHCGAKTTQFGDALNAADPLPGEQALYGQFRLLLDAASKDPELKKVLVATAIETEEKVIKPFFEWKHNGRPAGNGWNRSVNNAQYGIDYFNRTGTSKSNMFDNRPNEIFLHGTLTVRVES
jgi:hypothetical protein